jgi:predicted P-loop ATPase
MQLRDAGMTRTKEAEDAYLAFAWHNRYHPIKDYLSSLAWDGQPHIKNLSEHFSDEYSMFPVWLRKWLIGSCAKVFMTPREPVQVPMLVLDGEQNLGKSQFTKYLCKPVYEYYYEGAINPDEKDCLIRVASKWIWEVSELGATTRKADQEALKAFLTYETVRVRRPYGKHDIEKTALATFIGTVNNYSGLFSDPTGSRRYLKSSVG